jgi:(p)ppGpp synthase/HD superfamily hydrolase
MILTERVERALVFAACKHEGQTRKGVDTPYITHPVAVAMLVHEHGGNEDEVLGALLHDTVEDCGGLPVLEEIRELFGTTVAAIVDGMTDSYDQENEKWQLRKERYIAHIGKAGASVRLVAVCDKLHNIRSILSDYQLVGAEIWKRFRGGKEGSLWYYRTLVDAFHGAGEVRLVDELDRAVTRLEQMAAAED